MIDWQWTDFESLSGNDLYEMLRQRQEVFLLEQQCFYSDLDGLDQAAHHLLESGVDPGEPPELAAVLGARWPTRLEPPERHGKPWTLTLSID